MIRFGTKLPNFLTRRLVSMGNLLCVVNLKTSSSYLKGEKRKSEDAVLKTAN